MSFYHERHSLPGFGHKAPEKRPDLNLLGYGALSKKKGILTDFLPAIQSFESASDYGPKFPRLLEFGANYHLFPLRHAFEEANKRPGLEVGVFIPTVSKSEGGVETLTVTASAKQLMATLLGIVGAKLGEDSVVLFDGVAVLRGHYINPDRAFIVSINSKTGVISYHPDFLPTGPVLKTVDQVVPQLKPSK